MTQLARSLGRVWLVAALVVTLAMSPAAQAPPPAPQAGVGSFQPAAPYGDVVTSPRHAAAIQRAREIVAAYMAERGVPGLSVAVGIGGLIVWAEGFGYANVEQAVPVTPLTRFRSGSVAKPITMAGVALLYERGRLDLNAPIHKYLPAFPDKGAVITPRMLAGHLAGFRHYPPDGDEFFNQKHYRNVEDALEIFAADPLLFAPGTRYSYSSYGTNLLGAVAQAAAGREFLAFIQENVFEPLAMRSTSGDHVDRIIPHRTSFYERTGGKPSYHTRKSSWGNGERGVLLNAPYTDNSNKYPSGGFITTPEDLVRFGSAHLQPGFLKAETLKLLFTSQKTAAGEETGYGMNWQIRTDEGLPLHAHSGSSVGGTSMLLVYPTARVVLALQANLTDANFRDLPQRVARLFLNRGGSF